MFIHHRVASPDYSSIEEKARHSVKPRDKPFRPRAIGLYLVDHHPIHSKGAYSLGYGPERKRHVPVPASFRARLSEARAGKAGAIRTGAAESYGVKAQR
jgi:hypothetical protein